MNRLIVIVVALVTGAGALMAQKQPTPKSQKEVDAIKAVFQATDPDARIKAAEELLIKFADTEFKPLALQLMAMSYQQKNDFEKMVVYAERTLEADPKNYTAMLLLAGGIAQRTREHDLDREEKLAQAEKYAKSAQDALKDAPKPNPQATDEQWAAIKKDYEAQAHEALGLIAIARKQNDQAVAEFKAASEMQSTPDPATLVRLAASYNQSGKPDLALATVDKIMAMPDVNPRIKSVAQAERVRATQAKSGGSKPATGNAPSPIEIKKP